MAKSQANGVRFWLCFLLAVGMAVNIFLSAYIMIQKSSNDDLHQAFPDKCFTDVPGGGGCFTVQTSPYAITLGIPNPFYGLFFFSVLLIFFTLEAIAQPSRHLVNAMKKAHKVLIPAVSIIMVAGSIFSVWLLFVQFFILQITCIYCLWVDAIMIIGTGVFFWLYKDEVKTILGKK